MFAQSPSAAEPSAVTRQFYHWYLESLAKDREPFTKGLPTLKTYVSAALIAEIDRKSKSPDGLDEDYFLKAQAYLDPWIDNISVTETSRSATAAVEAVTLGGKGLEQRKLTVRLRNEKGSWKITAVALSRN